MKVRDVASSAVVAVGPAQSLRDAAQLMAKHRVGSAVVQDAEQLVGILTERDVLNAVATGTAPDQVSVQEIMTADVVTVGPDWDLVEAAGEMARRRIRHLVVYEGGQLLGVLSVRDVLPALLPG
ncbi:MAG TPA: CBS domain-containing protein [Actinomycetota bacterium]|jgi:CBS domain-containing protein|nr:CBS domain-containing protein [Actinomycetota bacterium]